MLKSLVGILLFIFIFIAIIALAVLRFIYKGVKYAKEAQQQYEDTGGKRFNRREYIKYQQEKREKNPFGDDYFKSSDEGGTKKKGTKQSTTRRTTTTDSGVTIIDDRDMEEKRKIFDHDDGEYTDFVEIKD